MPEPVSAAEIIRRQVEEVDKIYRQATEDLNTVRAGEHVKSWKQRTAVLLAQHVGQPEARQFSALSPGRSFTNDLLEELSDEIEVYRSFLQALLKRHAGS
ncbi:hypothetical protein [Candidatus Nitrospira bockiana]